MYWLHAYPSAAISMGPKEYPPQQPKESEVEDTLGALLQSKNKAETLEGLLNSIPFHKKDEAVKPERWRCSICGYIHEGPMAKDFRCPVCKQGADKFIKIE